MKAEILFIRLNKSLDRKIGYNLDDGTNYNEKVSIEGKMKISLANKGKTSAFKGKSHTIETKIIMSEAKKGKCFHSEEFITKLSARMKGNNFGVETRFKKKNK